MESGVTLVSKAETDDPTLNQLPLTLYNTTHTTITSYSKVPRGLRFPVEVSGPFTRIESSRGSSKGQ